MAQLGGFAGPGGLGHVFEGGPESRVMLPAGGRSTDSSPQVPETAAINLTSRISFRTRPGFGQALGTEP